MTVFVVIFFKTMYNKTIIRFGFCDILNNQGLGKCYQPWPSASLITLIYSTLIIPDITKTLSNNWLIYFVCANYQYYRELRFWPWPNLYIMLFTKHSIYVIFLCFHYTG